MNGEEKDRLLVLETSNKLRWDNHDKRSEEIWTQIQGQVKAIFFKLDGLQCQTHAEKHKGHGRQIAWLWTLVLLILTSCVSGFWWLARVK